MQALFADPSEESLAKRIYSHLILDDVTTAVSEAREHLSKHPDSNPLRLVLLQALCRSGKEVEALEEWRKMVAKDNALLKDRQLLETLAWSVLNKGEASNQMVIKVNAMIGASMTRDAKAIPLILNALQGTNSIIRSMAVGLAAAYGDFPLQDEIVRLLKEEKVWYVRVELLKAIGQLRLKEAKDLLIPIIGDPETLTEEKLAAIIALVNMVDAIEDRELKHLLRSNRAGFRELACQIILHLDMKEKVDLIAPLLRDSNSHVRVSALNALALLNCDQLKNRPFLEWIEPLLSDPVPEVAITAAWVSLLHDDPKGAKNLTRWIMEGEERQARLAAGAIAVSGKKGVPLSLAILDKKRNPYIEVTLALGLIGQRSSVDRACKILDRHLLETGLLMWDTSSNPLFRSLAPSNVRHDAQVANYPKMVDQLTRLEVLQTLCIMQYPKAQEAVKQFLKTQNWGTVGAAAATLLQEGDDEALEVVRSLLKDPDDKVRIQAALILSMLGGDKPAIEVLKEAYPKVDREIKVHILEALAKAGDPSTLAFLIDRLNEPFQLLRVVAATAIIQCLYH